jgi:hypothetical protein
LVGWFGALYVIIVVAVGVAGSVPFFGSCAEDIVVVVVSVDLAAPCACWIGGRIV